MRIPNLMHGSFFLLGGYLSVTLTKSGFGFLQSALLTSVFGGILGAIVERFLIRRLNGETMPQVLLTLGLSLIAADASLAVWGGDPIQPLPPPSLAGSVELLGRSFPIFRLALILVAAATAAGLWLSIDRTLVGAKLRASVDDAEMADTVGIPVERLFTAVFAFGSALAAFGGAVSAPYLSVYPGLDAEILPLALIVVTLGGAGSLPGAAIGSLVVGFIYNFGQIAFPEFASVILLLPMLFILILRPQGLLGRPETASVQK
jgi:branched-chain amino acid transport system permease protein